MSQVLVGALWFILLGPCKSECVTQSLGEVLGCIFRDPHFASRVPPGIPLHCKP